MFGRLVETEPSFVFTVLLKRTLKSLFVVHRLAQNRQDVVLPNGDLPTYQRTDTPISHLQRYAVRRRAFLEVPGFNEMVDPLMKWIVHAVGVGHGFAPVVASVKFYAFGITIKNQGR